MPHLLLILLLVPIVGAGLVLAAAKQGIEQVRNVTLVTVLVSLALSVLMVVQYNPAPQDGQLVQMVSSFHWLNAFGTSGGPDVRLSLGVDGLSLWLIALTAVLMVPSVLVSWEAVTDRPASYYALMLLLQAGLVGVFAAQDIILFYIFFEFTLIPLFFMIGQWGGHDRRWAARKFFVYTFAGSAVTFLGLLFLVLVNSWLSGTRGLTFDISELTTSLALQVARPENREWWRAVAPWVFLALFAGFAIKVPLFPFHTWLPLAHVEAPTAGSVLLAGVLLKIGSYGFLRFALPIVPEGIFADYNLLAIPNAVLTWLSGGTAALPALTINGFDLIAWLSVIGIIYGALLALAQDDIKKLVAYSSVSHMGFCILGLFALNTVGITGGLLQMINHGLSTGALFAIVGMLYERYHTRDIEAYGGMARKFPVMCFCLMVVTFSSIGLPGLNGFTGEVLSLMGMYRESPFYAILSLSGIILGAWYMLYLVRRTFFGRFHEPIIEGHHHEAHPARDMNARELFALAPLLALIVAIGLFPQFFISRMEPSILKVSQTIADRRREFHQPVAHETPTSPAVAKAP